MFYKVQEFHLHFSKLLSAPFQSDPFVLWTALIEVGPLGVAIAGNPENLYVAIYQRALNIIQKQSFWVLSDLYSLE